MMKNVQKQVLMIKNYESTTIHYRFIYVAVTLIFLHIVIDILHVYIMFGIHLIYLNALTNLKFVWI